jgi:hypothetical protein
MNPWTTLLGVASFLSLLVVAGSGFYMHGFARGYKVGRRHADDWWIGVEKKVDESRQKIWKERT